MNEQTMTEEEARAILRAQERTRKRMSEAQQRRREKVRVAWALVEKLEAGGEK
jgi:hypothetical protein